MHDIIQHVFHFHAMRARSFSISYIDQFQFVHGVKKRVALLQNFGCRDLMQCNHM
ncbi:unnamed protein product [Amoebophrya sp. A120]|nr:unnamed protein product [Amoebophrya sp. A120]|eukprot:GSA120T00014817001.1